MQIFSTYGFVQKVHIFEREGKTVALVQYPDVRTADTARAALEGHAMYDGGHNVVSGRGMLAAVLPLACRCRLQALGAYTQHFSRAASRGIPFAIFGRLLHHGCHLDHVDC